MINRQSQARPARNRGKAKHARAIEVARVIKQIGVAPFSVFPDLLEFVFVSQIFPRQKRGFARLWPSSSAKPCRLILRILLTAILGLIARLRGAKYLTPAGALQPRLPAGKRRLSA